MKKNLYIIILSIGIIIISGCSQKISKNFDIEGKIQQINQDKNDIENSIILEKENIENIYENKLFGFKLTIPNGRIIEEKNKIESNMGMLVSFFPPKEETIDNEQNLSISLVREENIDNFYLQQKETIKDYINNFEEISNEKIEINKINGIKNIFKGQIGGEYLQRQQILLGKDGIIFIVTYTTRQNIFDKNLSQINNIINSLNF